MTAPDPRLDEIQAIPAEAVEAAARAMLDGLYSDKTLKVDDEDRDIVRAILQAAHPVLLAELRKAHEALEQVEGLHQREVIAVHEGYGEEAICTECGHRWPCDTRAAAAAAKGDERG